MTVCARFSSSKITDEKTEKYRIFVYLCYLSMECGWGTYILDNIATRRITTKTSHLSDTQKSFHKRGVFFLRYFLLRLTQKSSFHQSGNSPGRLLGGMLSGQSEPSVNIYRLSTSVREHGPLTKLECRPAHWRNSANLVNPGWVGPDDRGVRSSLQGREPSW